MILGSWIVDIHVQVKADVTAQAGVKRDRAPECATATFCLYFFNLPFPPYQWFIVQPIADWFFCLHYFSVMPVC